MKKLFYLKFTFILFAVFSYSCIEDNLNSHYEESSAMEQLKSSLENRYGIVVKNEDDTSIIFNYPDGRYLRIERNNQNSSIIMEGSRINFEKIQVDYFNKNDFNKAVFSNYQTGEIINLQDLIVKVNSFSRLPDYSLYNKPCSEYPDNTTFDSCFKSELNEFCDGAIGCAALMFFPEYVVTAIGIHCASCVAYISTSID